MIRETRERPRGAASNPPPNRTFALDMRIATYNVNGVRGRLDVLLRWLEMRRPDIVCLQELKAPEAAFPRAALEAAGYGAVWHGQKSWNGVAILSRGDTPIETRRGLPGDRDDPIAATSRRPARG